ncbi:MAG: acetoin utilization protein AcuC [Candidatus Nanopelagicales bacterium]
MSDRACFVWDDALVHYDFGPGHPLAPIRVALAVRLVRELGLLDGQVDVVAAKPASDHALLRVHTADYIEAVRRAGDGVVSMDLAHGLGTPDDPIFDGMHEASALVAGATLAAVGAVIESRAGHAVNLAGGLHHAMPDSASGFCIYNDVAVGIGAALDDGVERIAYLDVDVHHGDGVERIFWDDPRVLTISLHESPRSCFPGTGFSEDVGGRAAEGYAVNVPLPAGTRDAAWLRAFDAVVPPLLAEYRPQLLVSQHGCDSHVVDPLANLALTVDGQRAAYERIHDLAHDHSDGRWVATGGGGYALVEVVPRAWAHLVGILTHHPVDPGRVVPEVWRRYAEKMTQVTPPTRMTDAPAGFAAPDAIDVPAWVDGFDPADPVDRVIQATRKAVFPFHGLDPAH